MIRFALKCANEHGFESWFRSSEAFETLRDAGEVECPVCGDTDVAKALMAPSVAGGDRAPSEQEVRHEAIARLRREVEARSDYVGTEFAEEARRIHEGEVPRRSIWGQAAPEDARALVDDGIPILPLPFGPRRKLS